jgi:hypothetical protein
MKLAALLLSLACLFAASSALYGPKSDVILLTKKNFDKEVMGSAIASARTFSLCGSLMILFFYFCFAQIKPCLAS